MVNIVLCLMINSVKKIIIKNHKFKKEFGFKKVKIVNKNFLDLNLKNNYFDLIIGIDCVINYI